MRWTSCWDRKLATLSDSKTAAQQKPSSSESIIEKPEHESNEHWQLIRIHVEYVPHGFVTCTGILCLHSEACIKLDEFCLLKHHVCTDNRN